MCITTLPAWGMFVLLHAAARSCTSLARPAWFCKATRMFYLHSIPWHNLALVSWHSSARYESVSGCLGPQLGCLSAEPDFTLGRFTASPESFWSGPRTERTLQYIVTSLRGSACMGLKVLQLQDTLSQSGAFSTAP